MNNEPVAWMDYLEFTEVYDLNVSGRGIPLYTHPAKTPAKQKYDDCMKDCDEPNPVERLRFFLSCALTGQDWLDVEPFIDAITHPAKTLTDRIEELEKLVSQRFDDGKRLGVLETEDRFRKAINLTDEEIRQCILEYFESPEYKQYPLPIVSVQFARAILRKAQEK